MHQYSRAHGLKSCSSLFVVFVVVVDVVVFRFYFYNFLTCVYNCHDHWIMSSYHSPQFKYQWSLIYSLVIFWLLHLRCTGATSEARSVGALSVLTTTRMGRFAHRSAISSLRSPRALSSRVPTTLNFSSARFWFNVIPVSLSCWKKIKERKLNLSRFAHDLEKMVLNFQVRRLQSALLEILRHHDGDAENSVD